MRQNSSSFVRKTTVEIILSIIFLGQANGKWKQIRIETVKNDFIRKYKKNKLKFHSLSKKKSEMFFESSKTKDKILKQLMQLDVKKR